MSLRLRLVSHGYTPLQRAGTQLHAEEAVSALAARGREVHVLAADPSGTAATVRGEVEVERVAVPVAANDGAYLDTRHEAAERALPERRASVVPSSPKARARPLMLLLREGAWGSRRARSAGGA